MKKTTNLMLAGVLVALLVVGAAPPVVGTEYDIVVDGTGVYPDDVAAVQYAVDNYSRILLRGTFNFGDWGTVAVTTDDVEIHGEKSEGVYNTKIVGGQAPFMVGSSATGPLEWFDNSGALVAVNNFAVENVYFEDPIVAILVLSCHGNLRIIGNKIVDGRPVDFGGYPMNIGIYVGSAGNGWTDPTVVTAHATIANNYIDGRARSWEVQEDPWAVYDVDFGRWYRGIVLGIEFSNVDAHANIVGNEVVNTMFSGIKVANDGVLSEDLSATVTQNTIIPSPTESYGDPFDAHNVTVYFANNTVNVANPNSWGVACVSCYDSVIEKNSISYNGYLGGISLLVYWESNWPVTGNLVRNNRISGTAPSAMALWPALIGGEAPAENNTFVGNNISGFTPDPTVWGVGAHYVLMEGANGNLVVGRAGDVVVYDPGSDATYLYHHAVIDLGTDNTITGLSKYSNIGQQLSDVMRRKREMPM